MEKNSLMIFENKQFGGFGHLTSMEPHGLCPPMSVPHSAFLVLL